MKQNYKKILMADDERLFLNGFKSSWFYYDKGTISKEKYDDEFLITKMNMTREKKNARFIYYELFNNELIHENTLEVDEINCSDLSLGNFTEKIVDRFLQEISNGIYLKAYVESYFKFLLNIGIMDSLYILKYTAGVAKKQNIIFDGILSDYFKKLAIEKNFHVMNNIKYIEYSILYHCDLRSVRIFT
ncbi:hypothetical protein ITX54_08405 [Rouxiella silvae]|uniref:Uncharacterized protein n=1 Tax=Rouxiella silvae TaxID=1646373 RepID=A0AA41BVX0_9GAMM|nr:hypothetical protein [Rouxiella silvae]MBF6636675.1 hypothetical protein [Rouxiella silvae]